MSQHGAARWATVSDIRKAGMKGTSPQSILLGHSQQCQISAPDENHILTVAPPGSGKTTSLVIPALLTYFNSVVVTDPKGALTAQTARFRRDELGHKVVVLNPWADEINAALGDDLGDTGFNPLGLLKRDDPAVIDNAEMIAEMICPTPPDAKDRYFTQTGGRILVGVLLLALYSDKYDCTLPAIYRMVRTTREGWTELSEEMAAIEEIDLSDYAAEILGPLESERQFAGVEGALIDATGIYNPQKQLARHVARDEFDPADLKRGNVTVYIVVPSNRREANKAWMSLVMALCGEAVGRAGPSAPVLLLAEEFANLGYMPSITRAMAEYREAGLRCWLVIQNMHQLRRIYGQEAANEIVALCGVKQFFGVDDVNLAKEIEQYIGTTTEESVSYSDDTSGRGLSKFLPMGRASRSQMAVPLMRAQDILNMAKEKQLILVNGPCPPISCHHVGYQYVQHFLDRSDPNPYRNEPQKRRAAPLPASVKAPRRFKSAVVYALIAAAIYWLIDNANLDSGELLALVGWAALAYCAIRAASAAFPTIRPRIMRLTGLR